MIPQTLTFIGLTTLACNGCHFSGATIQYIIVFAILAITLLLVIRRWVRTAKGKGGCACCSQCDRCHKQSDQPCDHCDKTCRNK